MIFYLLNKGQQIVKILNNNETVESNLDEAINEASELKFSVPLQKRLDSNIYYVLIPTDSENDFYMFKIISEDIQKDRVEYSAVESAYDELKSYSYIKDIRPNQMNAAQMLQQVLKNTRWSLGYVEDTGIQSATFYYITILEAIQKIVDLFKVELTFTIQLDPVTQKITGRKVNLYQQQGRRTGKRFEYGSNLLTVTREEDSQNLVTALVGRGKGIQVSGQNTEDTTDDGYGRRLTFADVEWKTTAGAPVNKPKGQEYVEDPKATALYGFSDGRPRIGLVTFEDIEDPNQLLNATWSALLDAKRPKVSFKAEVTDVGDLQLGDTIAIIRHDLGIEYFTRVYKVHHDLKDKNKNTVEMGDDFSSRSITSAISTAIQTSQDATEIANAAATSANGKNRNFYSNTKPEYANEGDNLFLNLGNGETEMWVWHHGQWEFVQSTVELHTVQKQIQEAQSGLNDAQKQISDNLAKADGDIAELNASIRDQKKAVDTDIDELNASIRDQKGTIDGLSTTINTVAIPKITDVTNKVSDALTKINDQKNIVTGLQTQSAQQGKDISKITTDIHGVSVDLANLNGDVNQTKATVQGLQSTLGNAQGDIAQIKVDAKKLETSLSSKVDNSTYATFVNQTNQALNAKLVASDLNGYAKTTELQATASGLQLNIDSVNGRLDNLKIGTRNLLHGTSDQYRALTNNDENGRLQKTTASSSITSVGHYLTGAQFTYAATLMNTNNQPVQLEACLCDNSGNPLPDSFYSSSVSNADNRPVSVTFSITQKTWFIRTWLVFPNNDGTQGEQVYVKDERLVEGTTPNTWSPNPDDTEQSLTQLSARITANSQRFSSYYTKSETDAKADTAKSDAVNTIKGDANWTGLTNIITNSGFLQSADGFVQKVQQTTLPMLNGGGVNLVKGTSNDWQTLTGSGRFQQTTSNYWYSTSYEKTGDQITYSIRIKNTSSYPVCAEIVGYDSNQSTRVTAAQSPVVQPGAEQSVSVTLTISSSTWWVGGWVVTQDSSTPQLSIQVKSEKLERGSVATPWTPNSAELVTQVAFNELTQTVNGLQSTVSGNYGDLQTRISQTDSAIREELSNQITGVTNQITTTASGLTARIDNIRVGGRNLLHGTSDQYRTLTYKQQYYATTASDMWTSTKHYLDGDQFTYSATITNTSEVPVRLALYCYYNDKKTMLKKVVGPTVGPNLRSVPTSVSITIDNSTWFICSDIETLDGQASSFSIQVKNEQLEEGNVKTAWTTNPDDIASQFTEVNATIKGLQSTVGSNYSALQSQINQTATTIREEVTNSVSGLQTQITQQDNNFNVSLNSLRKETAWQKVTSAIDANNYKTTGNYWIQAVPNSNTPDSSEWAYLQVVAYPDVKRIKQTWQRDNNENEIYTRLLIGDNWTSWQRTVTGGNIMAQINMSAGTTLIQNDKIYMDASSTVFSGKAFIPDAAITNISADKINTGTLDAGRINVINLNANNITTGTINGANLKIDLNSGEILFQKGRIGSTNGYLNIDIDSGQMSVTDYWHDGFYFEDGKLYLSDNFALKTNWEPKYGVIRRSLNPFTVGESGIEIASPTGVSLQTMNYDGSFGGGDLGDQTKNGASVAIDKNGQALINGKQVGLVGGTFFDTDQNFLQRRPRIVVGTDAANSGLLPWGWGDPLNHVANRIVIDASYVHFPHSYKTTTGSAPNLCIASDGAIVRSTSASKYKTEIKRSYSTEYGEKLLNLPTAIWTDKGQKERYEAGKRHIKPEKYFGMIAEDLADAGLDLLVSRNPLTHEIEGIQYERIAPALLPVIKKLKDKVNELEKKINE